MAAIEEVNLEKILPSNGPSIKEVKKYLEKYSDEKIVIKSLKRIFPKIEKIVVDIKKWINDHPEMVDKML